ncbi:nuclear mRNA export, poly(A)+RNA binding protein [Mortierella hygrophila]|uniref:Nuclear mRNA export, poly(A)+RNA binding protein n=1 Tax=Mortierella hygrophila TaxID=979708 RepID=A0A9P6FHB5_9FUNG|nr:nuclear mRNA export, poly(A)+RNA binding protein [Mortierella hygrophila]
MQRDRDRRGGSGGRQSGNITGNETEGLFTSNFSGHSSSGGGGGGGGRVHRGASSGRSDRRRGGAGSGGGRRVGGLRGTSANLPHTRTTSGDLDGDLDMGEKKKSFNPYQRPGRSTRSGPTAQSISTDDDFIIFVSTTGNNIGTDSGLDSFLARKAGVKLDITNKKPSADNNTVSFKLPNVEQARAVRKLNGIKYRTAKLIIKSTGDQRIMEYSTRSGAPRLSAAAGTIDAIRTFIRSRHQNGFLDLESMAADPTLRAASIIPPGGKTSSSQVGAVLMKVASELFPDITTISLASNRLRSMQPISSITQFFPKLLNLSLKDNDITYMKDLEYISGPKKLTNLRELILLDNPVRDLAIEKNKDDFSYRSDITKMFPSLQVLDQMPVTSNKISFGLGDLVVAEKNTATLPVPIKGNFYDSPGTQAMAEEFLSSFFNLYDTNRSALEAMYDSSATFSYVADMTISNLQRLKGLRGDRWDRYVDGSRSLSRVKELDERIRRIHVGNTDIMKEGILKLPKTKHQLNDASKVCVDAWQTGGLLPAICIYIMVHGEYEESYGSRSVVKSFDRSFIIAPAPPNSQASLHGWKCIIISDQLIVRHYNGPKAWEPEADPNAPKPVALGPQAGVATGGATPGAVAPGTAPAPAVQGVQPDPQQTPMAGITAEQHALAQELQRQTGLNYPYAVQCLAAVAWDFTAAVALVNQERANIPVDAWQAPRF